MSRTTSAAASPTRSSECSIGVIESGIKLGVFKPDCDSFHIYLSILSLTYFYRRQSLHAIELHAD